MIKEVLYLILNYLKIDLPREKVKVGGYFNSRSKYLTSIDVAFHIFYTLFEYILLKVIQYFLNIVFNISIGSSFFLIVPLPFLILIEIGLSQLEFTKVKYLSWMISRAFTKSLVFYIIEITLGQSFN